MRTYSSQFYSNGGIPCFQKNQSSLFNKHPKLSVPLLSKRKNVRTWTLEGASSIRCSVQTLHRHPQDPLSQAAALGALHAYPEEGASHVIVTSYVFNNGKLDLERLKDLVKIVGKQRLILDLSCRKKDGRYAIVTDRWQKFSDVLLDEKSLEFLGGFADEFLVHGVDVEGKKLGDDDEELVALLGNYSPIPVTYAGGGVTVMDDVERIKEAGKGRVDVTVGSALDIFGGNLPYKDVVAWHHQQQESSSALH
ncbi:hypothetical protein HID58_094596 [Brassica napus]|uniref:1-(5-phosphoribosyl)-5-[(5-phosphoribosylamino)methylideneamino] imidazole-4-carboxamide isomerase HISN3, chloroplastic n=1 Tax=Brassica napus TaxID=3708 RepID=A0ABQ7X902_BRANA|nr:hypothetical protein HID58_094596 [Brassica napus]